MRDDVVFKAGVAGQRAEKGRDDTFEGVGVEESRQGGETGNEDKAFEGREGIGKGPAVGDGGGDGGAKGLAEEDYAGRRDG